MSDFLGFFKKLFFGAEISETDELKKQRFIEYQTRLDAERVGAESLETENADKNEFSTKTETK